MFPQRSDGLFCQQEKLSKSIHYLISKEDQVRTQISELEVLISHTEVRSLLDPDWLSFQKLIFI